MPSSLTRSIVSQIFPEPGSRIRELINPIFQLNICDLNCCCDIDCTNDMLMAFDCTKTEVSLADYFYGHGLQHCAIENGLFCIEKHNYGDELMVSVISNFINIICWSSYALL